MYAVSGVQYILIVSWIVIRIHNLVTSVVEIKLPILEATG